MSKLFDAIKLAEFCHDGQKDKAGNPYIHHPMRVMLAMLQPVAKLELDSISEQWAAIIDVGNFGIEELMICAVLHDVIEDCDIHASRIGDEFGSIIEDVVGALTRRKPDESYWKYIERLSCHPVAVIIKRADLADNLGRINEIPDESKRRSLAERYVKTMKMLESL